MLGRASRYCAVCRGCWTAAGGACRNDVNVDAAHPDAEAAPAAAAEVVVDEQLATALSDIGQRISLEDLDDDQLCARSV